MSTEERKERDKKRRRNTIIDAAERVIFSKGFEQVTMDEIAEEAELSKGTLYLYFKNKDDLIIALSKRGSNLLNSLFTDLFTQDISGIELIRKMGETYLDFVQKHPDYFHAFLYYESLQDAEVLEKSEMAQTCEQNIQKAWAYMVRALQIGMQDGTIDDSYNPQELALIILASTRGIVMMHHAKQSGHHFRMLDELKIDTQSLFENFLKLIGTGMAAKNKIK